MGLKNNIKNFIYRIFTKKHIKIGLALGSGGAKGVALIGALKAFEEENIKFDLVAGTSIGSIVGAMYALGYNAETMKSFLIKYKLTDKKQLLLMTLKGATVEKILNEVLNDKTFDDTLIPFCAVACDIKSGEEVIINKGKLSKALSASSAIPPIFKPVHKSSRKLIDGAFVNAVPSDVVKKMGADVVISIALHNKQSNAHIKKTVDLMYHGNGIKITNRLKQLKYSNYTIFPNLDDFTIADVKNLNNMYDIGYQAVKSNIMLIKKIIHKKGKLYI